MADTQTARATWMEICDRCGKLKASHRGGLCYPDTAPSSREEFVPSGRFPEPSAPPVAVPASSEARGATELQQLPWWDNVHFERMAEVKRNRGFVPIEDERASQLNCRERQLRDYKAKYEAALREIAELPERPIPQGGDYRPHYPKRTADAYMDALERQLAEAQRTIAALRSKVVT